MFRSVLVAAVVVAFCGCAARQTTATYRLVRQSDHPVLIPPSVSQASIARRSFHLAIPPGSGGCVAGGGIEIRKGGKHMRVSVASEVLARQAPGWLMRWASDAESAGCIAPGYGISLAVGVADSVPLPVSVGWSLLHVNDIQAGYVDVGAGNRLQVDSPIYEQGATPPSSMETAEIAGSNRSINVEVKAPPGLIGFERAWYAVQPRRSGAGFSIVPLSAERHVKGDVETTPEPATNYFQFGAAAAYYRLLYRADRSIIVLAAPRYAELETLTRRANSDATLCEASAHQSCVLIPNSVGVNLDIVAIVNGRELLLPAGANVANAIVAAGARPQEILRQLRIARSYSGRLTEVEFDHSTDDILSLRLVGGETLTWNQPH